MDTTNAPRKNQMEFATKITAKFQYQLQPTPEEQAQLDALNAHAEEICERLQGTFRNLIIEFLEVKKNAISGGK